jgi:hypothetical protein
MQQHHTKIASRVCETWVGGCVEVERRPLNLQNASISLSTDGGWENAQRDFQIAESSAERVAAIKQARINGATRLATISCWHIANATGPKASQVNGYFRRSAEQVNGRFLYLKLGVEEQLPLTPPLTPGGCKFGPATSGDSGRNSPGVDGDGDGEGDGGGGGGNNSDGPDLSLRPICAALPSSQSSASADDVDKALCLGFSTNGKWVVSTRKSIGNDTNKA